MQYIPEAVQPRELVSKEFHHEHQAGGSHDHGIAQYFKALRQIHLATCPHPSQNEHGSVQVEPGSPADAQHQGNGLYGL